LYRVLVSWCFWGPPPKLIPIVSVIPSPDFSKLRIYVSKPLLDSACVSRWWPQGQHSQNRTHGPPTFLMSACVPQPSESHPLSTRKNPRTLPRLSLPFQPTFPPTTLLVPHFKPPSSSCQFCLLHTPKLCTTPSITFCHQSVPATTGLFASNKITY
jgi:hypothetical protein